MLTSCPECKLQVSDKAAACPHCGYPMQPLGKQKKSRPSTKRRRLPNGFGQISEIKGKYLRNPFRAMVPVGKTSTGRVISKPLKPVSYFPTYNEAYAALVEYNKNPYDLDPAITVAELYDKWSREHYEKLTENGVAPIKLAWTFCSAIYNMRVMDLRARHIKGCMEEGVAMVKGKEQGPSTICKSKIKSMFNLMLDYAVEYEMVDRNYARTFNIDDKILKEITTVKNEHIPFTEEEMALLWEYLGKKEFVDVMLIQCYSGWRPQELAKLKLEDVDIKNWTFTGGMKTDAGVDRTVPIHPRIQSLVMNRHKEATELGSEYLFNYYDTKSKKHRALTYNRYTTGFAQIRDELKLNPKHRPHDGRKHFVTAAKKNGVDEYAIKYMVGHTISDITEKTYTEREFKWLREEIEKIK